MLGENPYSHNSDILTHCVFSFTWCASKQKEGPYFWTISILSAFATRFTVYKAKLV